MATITGTQGDDTLIGTAAADFISAGAGNDSLRGGAGNDTLAGGGGTDVAIFSGRQSGYSMAVTASGAVTVRDIDPSDGDEGTDTLLGIQGLNFANGSIGLARSGSATGETRINTYTQGGQVEPVVATLNDGGYVVVWTSGSDSRGGGLYGQRYAFDSLPVGVEFRIFVDANGGQNRPAVAALADGGFVVTWETYGRNDDMSGVFAQIYGPDGTKTGGDFQVNTYETEDQREPAVVGLSDGGFVVTWQSDVQDGVNPGVYAQRFGAGGAKSGQEFRVNTWVPFAQERPEAATLAAGGFVIAWESLSQDGEGEGVYAQRFDSQARPAGAEFRVNTATAYHQEQVSVAGLADGGFLVTWNTTPLVQSTGVGASGVYAQRYSADGTAAGQEFHVNNTNNAYQQWPSAVGLVDGGYVIAWQAYGTDGSQWGVYAQRYSANGAEDGPEFRINSYTASDQSSVALASMGDGGFLATWQSYNQDGVYGGIYAQRYDAEGQIWSAGQAFAGGTGADTLSAGGSAKAVILQGLAGDDVLSGGLAADTLDGGAGRDAAAYAGASAQYTVSRNTGHWHVIDKSAATVADTLLGIEQLRFSNLNFELVRPALTVTPTYAKTPDFLFDPVFYLLDNPDLVPSVALASAAQHYLGIGAAQGHKPNSWFDAAYYENRWSDLRPLNLDDATLFRHYNLYGVWEGRSAGPALDRFNGTRYLGDNPDVAAYVDAHVADFLGSRSNGAIAHYMIYGASEGRGAVDLAGAAITLDYTVDLGIF